MSDETQVIPQDADDSALAAPPDDQNQAMIEAEKTFVITMISSALFIGAVLIFIL